jgi:NAD-dependent DNA ligase
MEIVRKRLPGIEDRLLEQVVNHVQQFRQRKLVKTPGISETIDWAESLMALGFREVNKEAVAKTLGSILKSTEDILQVREELLASME